MTRKIKHDAIITCFSVNNVRCWNKWLLYYIFQSCTLCTYIVFHSWTPDYISISDFTKRYKLLIFINESQLSYLCINVCVTCMARPYLHRLEFEDIILDSLHDGWTQIINVLKKKTLHNKNISVQQLQYCLNLITFYIENKITTITFMIK